MATSNRRTFLKQSAVLLPGGALLPRTLRAQAGPRRVLDVAMLRGVGRVVLPAGELGADGVERVVSQFAGWLEGFEPVAELNHGYLTDEIEYAPPDPAPRWGAQLEALALEGERRFGRSFDRLTPMQQADLIRRSIGDEDLRDVGNATEARHVAVGLMAYFYATAEANDLCYHAEIGRHACRGLGEASQRPRPLSPRE